MREIKFKVRDRKTKQFIGYECLMAAITNDGWAWAKSYGGRDWENGIYYDAFDDHYLLRQQFTGFTNNGEDWYEGDILESDGDWYQIEWCDEQGRWIAAGVGSTHQDIDLCELLGSETWLQGNIYENPELLKSES
jgi:hypothetical protein